MDLIVHPRNVKQPCCSAYTLVCILTSLAYAIFFKVHTGLIKCFDIPPKTVHKWRVRGVLVDEIKNKFSQLPEGSRGLYYPWFLENEHIIALAGLPLCAADAAVMRAWRFTGGSEGDSVEKIKAAIARKPVEEQDCHLLYSLLLSELHPAPSIDLWVNFGFPSCRSQEEEMELARLYRNLIRTCTFKEFCDAYRTHRLPDLFDSNSLQVNNRVHFQNVLQAGWRKSVWYLKQTVAQEDFTEAESNMVPAVSVDYGFANCRNDSEKRRLWKVYKDFFNSPNGDPLALHEAAMVGNIHGYVSSVANGLQDPMFQRLMKNPYPVPEFD
jgi:hypothetical protein